MAIESASIYSLKNKGGIAYQVAYKDGTKVRAVKQIGNTIRCEVKRGEDWIASEKNPNSIVSEVESFLVKH